MNDQAPIPTLLFTFSSNGESNGQMLVEATAEELMEQDRSVAPGAYKRRWFGPDSDFEEMLANTASLSPKVPQVWCLSECPASRSASLAFHSSTPASDSSRPSLHQSPQYLI